MQAGNEILLFVVIFSFNITKVKLISDRACRGAFAWPLLTLSVPFGNRTERDYVNDADGLISF